MLYGKNSFAQESKNLARYKSENIFVISQNNRSLSIDNNTA